jgi:GNAT superfamily N-acetyltransferase
VGPQPGVRVAEATTAAEIDDVRALMRAFVAWHRARHVEDLELIDRYFSDGAFETELAELPGAYAPPDGRLLLATCESEPAGCVALRAIGDGACEMKRMFVPPRFQGLGVGRALAEAVVADARAIGYREMWLDTSVRQVEALGLYESLGFEEAEPYHELPDEMVGWLVFRRLTL